MSAFHLENYLPCSGQFIRLSNVGTNEQGQFQGKREDLCLADVISVANMWLWCGCGGSSVQERCGDWIGLAYCCLFYVTGNFILEKTTISY